MWKAVVICCGLSVCAIATALYLSTTKLDAGAASAVVGATIQTETPKTTRALPTDLSPRVLSTRRPRTLEPSPYVVTSTDLPDKIIDELRNAAQAGEPSAMYELAAALETCAKANMGSNDAIEKDVAAKSIELEDLLNRVGDKANRGDPNKNAAEEVRHQEAIRDSCHNVAADETKSWRDWLLSAAKGGSNAAREDFARNAQRDGRLLAEGEGDAKEVVLEKAQAYEFLQDAMASGDCSSTVLNSLMRLSPDQQSSYVYYSLLLKRGASIKVTQDSTSQNAQEQSSLALAQSALDAAIPQEQLQAIKESVIYLRDNYCPN